MSEIRIHKHWRIKLCKLRTLRKLILANINAHNSTVPSTEEDFIGYLIDYYADREHITKFTPCEYFVIVDHKKLTIACNKDGIHKEIDACFKCDYNKPARVGGQ
jgi:hypothetical protein